MAGFVGRSDALATVPDAFARIRSIRPDGLLATADPLIGQCLADVIAFAASTRLPESHDFPNWARDGSLIAYCPQLVEHYVMAAA
jgi:hypothetical protein